MDFVRYLCHEALTTEQAEVFSIFYRSSLPSTIEKLWINAGSELSPISAVSIFRNRIRQACTVCVHGLRLEFATQTTCMCLSKWCTVVYHSVEWHKGAHLLPSTTGRRCAEGACSVALGIPSLLGGGAVATCMP